MLLVFSVSMMITVVMSILFYQRSAVSLVDHYTKNVTENLTRRTELFDSMMKDAYLTCVCGATDPELQNLLSEHGENQNEELTVLLRKYLERSDNIHSVYCYLPEEDVIVQVSEGSEQVQAGTDAVHTWAEDIRQQSKRNDPFSPVFNKDKVSVFHRHFFTFSKEVFRRDGGTGGILFINVDERRVYFSCLRGETDVQHDLYLMNGSLITSGQSESMLGTELKEPEHILKVSANAQETEYTMLSLADRSVITEDLKRTGNRIILMAVFLNLLCAVPVYLLIRHLMRPLKELEQDMNRVREGDFTVRAKVYREDEIGSLSEHFNEMIGQIEQLIEDLVTQRMLKKEAEIEALQYQITPHFMYNTLNSIKYAAILQNADHIAELLQAFTELLRMSASDRGSFITVGQEIHMVQNYMMLQQFRYENSFSAEYEIEAGAEGFYVPRLLIQPLVENAILHGLDHGERDNQIKISVRQTSGLVEIKVADNGSGMSQEELDRLLSGQYRSKFNGIGIHNIIERLRLYYGADGNLEYRSFIGKGTTAIITFPATDDPEAYTI